MPCRATRCRTLYPPFFPENLLHPDRCAVTSTESATPSNHPPNVPPTPAAFLSQIPRRNRRHQDALSDRSVALGGSKRILVSFFRPLDTFSKAPCRPEYLDKIHHSSTLPQKPNKFSSSPIPYSDRDLVDRGG